MPISNHDIKTHFNVHNINDSPTLTALVIFHIMTLIHISTLTFYSYFLLNVHIIVKHKPWITISFIFVHPIQLFLLLSSSITKQWPVAREKASRH